MTTEESEPYNEDGFVEIKPIIAVLTKLDKIHEEDFNGKCGTCWDYKEHDYYFWPCPTAKLIESVKTA